MAAKKKKGAKKKGRRNAKGRTPAQQRATRRMIAANKAARGSGGGKRSSGKKSKRGSSKRAASRGGRGGRSLEARVSRLERGHQVLARDLGAVHNATLAVVNVIRTQRGADTLKRLPGYRSPGIAAPRTAHKALPSGGR